MLEGVDLILSAGDLHPEYLEFLVTVSNVPLLYVRGNHDDIYENRPPLGCADIDGSIAVLYSDPKSGRSYVKTGREKIPVSFETDDPGERLIIAGLGGSMRYRPGNNMYTEREMSRRVRRLRRKIRISMMGHSRSTKLILLTHAPSAGHGDLEDLPHRGFKCFNRLIHALRPEYHCYGHVHLNYGRLDRIGEHPSGTTLINCSGMYILEI